MLLYGMAMVAGRIFDRINQWWALRCWRCFGRRMDPAGAGWWQCGRCIRRRGL